jgi:hypothetical protein
MTPVTRTKDVYKSNYCTQNLTKFHGRRIAQGYSSYDSRTPTSRTPTSTTNRSPCLNHSQPLFPPTHERTKDPSPPLQLPLDVLQARFPKA